MAGTVPTIRFVKCPKCFKVLTEFSEIPVYKCGGCDTILRAKIRTGDGEKSNTGSASGFISLSDNSTSNNGLASLIQKIPASVAGEEDQPVSNNLHCSQSESNNTVESHLDSESNNVGSNGKEQSSQYEQHKNGQRGLDSNMIRPTDQFSDDIDRVNPAEEGQAEEQSNEVKTSPKIRQEANESLKSSDKLDESSESTEHGTTSEENMINMDFRNYTSFTRNSSKPYAYDGGTSSVDEDRDNHIPHKYLLLSRRTLRNKKDSCSFDSIEAGENFTRKVSSDKLPSAGNAKLSSRHETSLASEDFNSVQSWMESDNSGLDAKLKIRLRISEQEDHVKILKKVDELKSDLRGLFNRTADGKGFAWLGGRATHFEGKVPTKEYRSSLIPFSKEPNSSFFHYHNDQCKPYPNNICCRLQKERTPPAYQEPLKLQSKASMPRTVLRHCRPLSGGAPFVICHKCFNLLQLPADFLVSTKKINKLRCGACSQVLLYSFRPRPQSKPQSPPDIQHPPSEDDDELNFLPDNENSALQVKEFSHWDPISISEEYGISNEIVEEEVEWAHRQARRLHNLMGYNSASELLFRTGYSDDGYQSTEPDLQSPSERRKWQLP